MTDGTTLLLALSAPVLAVLAGVGLRLTPPARGQDRVNAVCAVLVAGLTAAVALRAMLVTTPASATAPNAWVTLDPLAGVFLLVIAAVGLGSALVSPAYLQTGHGSFFRGDGARGWYYLCFYLFWAALLAIPVAGNLGVAWVIVEGTTGVSALLVVHSGRQGALEAGWKYLVLTTLGLTVALLGIIALYAAAAPVGASLSVLSWTGLARAAQSMPHQATLTGFVLLMAGWATKVGWAPVHNWLPDAHSEAPPPVSAMLSAALLPTVMVVAWRSEMALRPALGPSAGRLVFVGFGLASLALAVPFLWRPMAWKRLLAYSSLEHMGILALGIGFGHPLAIAGVVLHVAGHGLAKSLGFWSAIPLFQVRPLARKLPVRGLLRADPALAAEMSLSLATLSGLPPSPLFFSEVLILMGGFLSGHAVAASFAALLLALGVLGLARVLVEGLLSRGRSRRPAAVIGARMVARLGVAVAVLLALLAVAAPFLPGTQLVHILSAGLQ